MNLLEIYTPVSKRNWSQSRMLTKESSSNAQTQCKDNVATPLLNTSLARFPPITLMQMNNVALLDRAETKYLLHREALPDLLDELLPHYHVLVTSDARLARYRTLYYDTEEFTFYHDHHAGLLGRYKIRARQYMDSSASFLEIKHKTNKNRTLKYRLPIAQLSTNRAMMDGRKVCDFIQNGCPYSAEELRPVLWSRYRRITLVHAMTSERVTIDVDLAFSWQNEEHQLPKLVIAEVKQADRKQPSPFVDHMLTTRVNSGGFSKYCMGMTLLYPTLKANRFKKKQRHIAKLLQMAPWPKLSPMNIPSDTPANTPINGHVDVPLSQEVDHVK